MKLYKMSYLPIKQKYEVYYESIEIENLAK